MSRFNQGTVFTAKNCVGCNKCISVCPVLGANVSVADEGHARVEVSQKCIECGLCVTACNHHARDFRDDSDAFFEDLNKGEKISVLVDPTFYLIYENKASAILAYLKKAGVNKIYDVAFGAEISAYFHAKYIKEHMDENGRCKEFIINSCAAVVNFAENAHPGLLPLMIPVQSPSLCTAIYVKNVLKDDSKLAYISPCLTQADEIRSNDNGAEVTYSVTFKSLSKKIKVENLPKETAKADLKSTGVGNLASYMSGFLDMISLFFERSEVTDFYNGLTGEIIKRLENFSTSGREIHPIALSIMSCYEGCVGGNGIRKREINPSTIIKAYEIIRENCYRNTPFVNSPKKYYERAQKRYADLDIQDYMRIFHDRYRQPYIVPEDAIQDIFLSMHKDTKVKQNINCESCGYRSCKDMATAIANGYARIQDCVYYMNDDLRFAALKDRMTGIYNSLGFRKYAGEMLKENPSKRYRVYAGNVNKLKSVNDLYGSESGDKVLCYIAKRLSDFVEGKGLCARFGGGVFSVFLEDKEEYIKDFSTLFTSDVRHLGIDFPITIRYGFYKIDDNSMDIGSVTNLCTYAADMATDRTQNTFVEFTDSMKNEMKIETDITLNMKGAMEKGEFVLFMQPQYNHKSGKIVGAEALSRWKKPDGTIVSPGIFIPVFEKNGFIKALDKYVWESVFKLVSEWEKSDVLHVPVSVNISRISLETDDIVDTIAVLSKKYPINKNNLYFEITESAYMKNQDEIVDRVTRIKNLGYKIAMDDFGSGYSSLNSLKDIPLDVLKLDMGFLRGGTNVERGNNIIAYMVDMAKALQLKIVAEGVETKEQADFLTERGCDVIQGFYYAKPMPLFDYEEKLSEK